MASPPKPPPLYVNWRGEPVDLLRLSNPPPPPPPPGRPARSTPAEPSRAAVELTAEDLDTVYDTLCLAGMPCSSDWLLQFLHHLGRKTSSGAAYARVDLKAALATLVKTQRLRINSAHLHEVPLADLQQALPRVIQAAGQVAWQAWARASAAHEAPGGAVPQPRYTRREELPALVRLLLYSGCSVQVYEDAQQRVLGPAREADVLAQALCTPFMPELWAQAQPALRHRVFEQLMRSYYLMVPHFQPLLHALQAEVQQQRVQVPPVLRCLCAESQLLAGDTAAAAQALQGLGGHSVELLQAALLARQGQWAAAATAFATTLKEASKALGIKRGLAPYRVLQWYVLSLLAQPDPQQWAVARKFCIQQSGSRTPRIDDGWGVWAYAIAVRLGDSPLQPELLRGPQHSWELSNGEYNAHRLVLAAWLGEKPSGWTAAALATTRDHLLRSGLGSLVQLTATAARRSGLRWPEADATAAATTSTAATDTEWATSFFGTPREAWRDALAAIEALGTAASKPADKAASSVLQWHLSLDNQGRVTSIVPFEQTLGVRRPGKRKVVPLSRLKKSEQLDPLDAAVVRCILADRWRPSHLYLDTVAAAVALVGHPQLVLADAPQQLVDLREGLPQLEVRRQKQKDGNERFVFHLLDPLTDSSSAAAGADKSGDKSGDDVGDDFDNDDDDDDSDEYAPRTRGPERERFNSLRVVRDAPDRARLIRVNAAQRRVAELVAKQWSVPVEAKAELDGALRVLAGHFQLHSDATAGQEVDPESRLRALLSPQGDGLQLRLVVQPFGSFGPAVLPGQGRSRLLTLNEGLNLATQRDLAAEKKHLRSVLEALPQLAGTESGDSTWALSEPEEALAVLEQLPQLAAIAGVDWPRGKPVRLQTVATEALQVRVKSGTDWLGLEGELQLSEGRVVSLQRLLTLAHESRRGRFLALGDGDYLALTEQLKRQLAELQALAQADGDALKLPHAASNWLADTLDSAQLKGDKAWKQRLTLLAQAAELQPEVPGALQAQLRSYQHDGYAWMARLAHAGLGACLADDMGLGKTVQTLSLLLQRASLGPALVLAPTSVCGNWLAETQRFAPSLQASVYGSAGAGSEGERSAALQTATAGQVVIASYALSQIDSEAFATVPWATVVMDEAQALKNAATKRAKSAASLQAGFKLALTGTPVENRLADLWSIMNLINPGLLGSATRFAERFANPIERDRDDATRQRLRRICAPFLLRRTKAQVLTDLPPRTEIIHRVEPGPEERAFLEAARRAALERVAQAADGPPGQAAFHVLAELTRLRRAACDPRLVAPELGLIGAKVHEFEQLATELVAGRHKALVFSQFTDFLKLLGQRLEAAGLSYQYLDGSTPAAQRSERVAAFQRGEGDLFLISLKAGGFGLNLTAADYVIIVDPWWNPAAEDQALGRAHRIGQQRPVTVYRLVPAG